MRQVERSAIVPFSAGAMFDLVADVESYPQFLPGCTGASVSARQGDSVIATLQLSRGPLRTEFTTRNRMERPACITMELEHGPFSELHGAWTFAALGEGGSRVSLSVRFGFASRVTDMLLGPAFETLCAHLVDAFVSRARDVCRPAAQG
jgi:ribosome-associated toxin RatA of RatAB toxin-antitoxin module